LFNCIFITIQYVGLLAMSNYDSVRGATYDRWETDADEPTVVDESAKVEELYYDKRQGDLYLTMTTEEGYVGVTIPIKARKDWNEFVASLPTWEIDDGD